MKLEKLYVEVEKQLAFIKFRWTEIQVGIQTIMKTAQLQYPIANMYMAYLKP
jgi:hypothetical protein